MNPVVEEMRGILEDGDYLEHIGMPRRSGRYPWGSGDNPYQRNIDLLGRIEELRKQGWTETAENIKNEFGLTTNQYRAQKGLARAERRMLLAATAKSLKEDGLTDSEIGRKMGINESSVRALMNEKAEARMYEAKNAADFIRNQIETKGMIEIGVGAERELGISKEKFQQALTILEMEGYPIYTGGVAQVTNKGQQTIQKVICPPGTPHKDIYNYADIHPLNEDNYTSRDGGNTFEKFEYPKSMDSKRLMVRYAEDGGVDMDGIIELRRGVDDLSLGESKYSQVRILVDGNKYLKGMAVYSDNMPDGVDVVFNTNKTKDVAKMDVLKTITADPDNPFGSLIKANGQYKYVDADGNEQLGLINKRADQGDWTEWKDALPSQFLAKQALPLAKKQLKLAIADKTDEYETICSLENPTVKKVLLSKFADECDSAAVHLQAAALPGQKYHVIVPINTLKDTEIYAPGYEPGTKLALVRYPHGGTFEIPILTVNNKNADGKKIIGSDSIDAVGITKSVADRLSGADFDGDTVMCIPTHDRSGKIKVTSTKPLKGLEGFDPKAEYAADKVVEDSDGTKHYYQNGIEYRIMKNTGTQMGTISNLITDMTLQGAPVDELARAVRHSMVVIDAEKHKLNYKKSEQDNGIASLAKEYQTHITDGGKVVSGGASTLLSRSKGQYTVPKRQGNPRVNLKDKEWYDPTRPEGSLIYKNADDLEYTYTKVNKKTGEETVVTAQKKQRSTRMAETDDAYTLISEADTAMERAYADYANKMKSMANEARKTVATTGKIKYDSEASTKYAAEVSSLKSQLNTALLNAPRERQAQRLANVEVSQKVDAAKAAGSDLKTSDVKKVSQQAITKYRTAVGSVSRTDRSIKISDKEWEAIQAGAISETRLLQILNNTDIDNLRERATPRATTTLSPTKISRIQSYAASGYTLNEIAAKLNLSTSTVAQYTKGAK